MGNNYITIENEQFRLLLNENCETDSLILKASGEECIAAGEELPLFSVTEERPFNNEVKLAYPNKKTVFQANRVNIEDDVLTVGFNLVPFEARIKLTIKPQYIAFKLIGFNVLKKGATVLSMDYPPVLSLRLLQLPVKLRQNFGEWLNVSWDEKVAVNVLATSPYALIDSEQHKKYMVLSADAHRDVLLEDCEAALIVTTPDKFLDCVECIEEDYNLPKGVKARRSPTINRSIFWSTEINPRTVDRFIEYAKEGGFEMMELYYSSIFKKDMGYTTCGEFNYRDEYPNGAEDLKNMLKKIKDAGITPGLHILQTFIGIDTSYVTPVADHRLNLTRHFTLAKPLGTDDTTIYVEENPRGAVRHEKCRVLRFGGELIYYEDYSTEYPYCFKGCKRGHFNTNIVPHEMGTIGGILDITEYTATAVYIDQKTNLQDEIADKIAEIYDLGFEFLYFDGSEGVDAPYEFYVPYAQYRVYRKLGKEPLFCEGAAKSHFSWHMLSGSNAFDAFVTSEFKERISEFPLDEVSRMAEDFTRVNFGWWRYYGDTQPDMYEYSSSLSAAWDCPATMMAHFDFEKFYKSNPRTKDVFEVLRRWEDVRRKKWLTPEQKQSLRNADQEHILLVNENNEYELLPYDEIKGAANDEAVRAFAFERNGKAYVVCWHASGEGKLALPLVHDELVYEEEIGGEVCEIEKANDSSIISLAGRRYLSAPVSKEELVRAFLNSKTV